MTIPDYLGDKPVGLICSSAFADCSGLTSVTIPNGMTSIGEGAFSGCSGLTSVTIPDSVTSIGKGAFYGCNGLTSIRVPDGMTSVEEWFDTFEITVVPNLHKLGTVSGGGTYAVGARATIKATAKSGYVFAAWFTDKACTKALNPKGYDNRKPTVKYAIPAKNTTVYAKFVSKSSDKSALKFSSATKKLAKTPAKATAGSAFSLKLGVSSASLPTFTAKGLPKGLSIDKITGEITGVGTVPGAYSRRITRRHPICSILPCRHHVRLIFLLRTH